MTAIGYTSAGEWFCDDEVSITGQVLDLDDPHGDSNGIDAMDSVSVSRSSKGSDTLGATVEAASSKQSSTVQ